MAPGKRIFKTMAAVILSMMCMAMFVSQANAEIKITIKNNKSHNLSFAFRWLGFDMPDDKVKGWYSVPAGQTKTFTFDVAYALTASGFGYYAQGGGKTWRGDLEGWIHPKSKFSGNLHEMPSGMKKVGYRVIKLRQTSDDRVNGAATITFGP